MPDPSERELFDAIQAGDDRAFERIYDRYHQKARLMAWRLSHRRDWIDDLLNETWCRAFRLRKAFDPDQPFAPWLAAILQNVYREFCRKSPTTFDPTDERHSGAVGHGEEPSPASLAAEAELLAELNDCVARLAPVDARIIRLRFFDGLTLRAVAQEVAIPEATLRETRLPAAYGALRRCLEKKGLRLSELFPAREPGKSQ